MVTEQIINNAFVEILKAKIPQKNKLVSFLTDTLSIERETAYRRLRGATMFSMYEVAILAEELKFSIDEIVINSKDATLVSNMMMKSYFAEDKGNFSRLDADNMELMKTFTLEPDGETGMALKSIPFQMLLPYESLSRYYKFKYAQHESNPPQAIPFKQTSLNNFLSENTAHSHLLFQQISHTVYIWDKKIIPIIINDINYFHTLGLMDGEDVAVLKKDLFHLMDMLEQIASRGLFEKTGNRCDIYISDEDIDSTYCYFRSKKACLSLLLTHLSYVIISYNNQQKCQEVVDWITSMKYNSTLISGTGGKERVQFFNAQREIIGTL